MNTYGWILITFFWGIIISIAFYTIIKVLRSGKLNNNDRED